MNPRLLTAGLMAAAVSTASAETLLFADNFDVADTTNFDGAPLDGRRTGTLAETVFLRSSRIQQHILSNQLRYAGSGRVRFQNSAGWFNWAGGDTGATILADGGLRIEFDWTPTNDTSTNWVSFTVGFPNLASLPEPGTRVNHIETDYGILFRNNGNTERFDNGANKGAGGFFNPVLTPRHVVIDYAFGNFGNGQPVKVRASVDGTVVTTGTVAGHPVNYETFLWENNAGELFMELGTNETGSLVDNLSVSTIPVIYEVALAGTTFISGISPGETIGTLSGETFAKGPEVSTFEFVSGDGDFDNDKFQIVGNQIQPGSYDFTQDFEGWQYFIRVKGTSTESAGEVEQEFILTLIKDDDADDLQDDWELLWAGNLTDLNGKGTGPGPGPGTGDFDGDGILDIEEYALGQTTWPGINPMLADSDGDGLNDLDEINGAGLRPPTSPINPDTDGDGLEDGVESNTGTFVGASDTGTNPALADTDGDGARDGFELERESDPTDYDSRPSLPPGFTLATITSDASSGISAGKVYTHAISGGGAATVNGVVFNVLTPTETPANFIWSTNGFGMNAIAPINNGQWVPANGGVTDPGLLELLGGFTYSGSGDLAGRRQTFTLTGLTPGVTYDLRLYLRPWGTVLPGTPRPIDFTFTNGEQIEVPFGALLVDRPAVVFDNGNIDTAYYLSFTYTAEGEELSIEAKVPESAVGQSGSFHMYGLTNEALLPPSGDFRITGVTRDTAGNIILDFIGEPDTAYQVTKSPDLVTPFGPLTEPLTATTNAAGVGQAIVPASEASEASEFYRIEDIE